MKRAGPFDALLGMQRSRLPASSRAAVVFGGKVITDLRQLPEEERDLVREELKRARDRVKHQRARLDPVKVAKRQAWNDANRDKIRAYKRDYDARTRDRQREQKAAYMRRKNAATPELHRQAWHNYYERHREVILARQRERRAQRRAERLAASEGAR